MVKAGDIAPDFTLPSTVGDKVTLSDYRGKKNVLLMFYPLDFSPVCSAENKLCSTELPNVSSADVAVLGISVDSLWSHKAFAVQQNVSYPLLADFNPKGDVAQKYGVYLAEKGFAARTAFVIGKDGIVKDVIASEVPKERDIVAMLKRTASA